MIKTVGDLKTALADYPDEMPVKIWQDIDCDDFSIDIEECDGKLTLDSVVEFVVHEEPKPNEPTRFQFRANNTPPFAQWFNEQTRDAKPMTREDRHRALWPDDPQ